MDAKTLPCISLLDCRVSMLLLAASCCLLLCNAAAESTQKVGHSESLVQTQPIVIQTQAQNYEQPTLSDYHECHTNRDNCIQVCQTAAKQTACVAECPTCPILISQDVVVQGINDTDYSGAPSRSRSGNTTNVIRLTNEIRNIIDYNSGNVTVHNEDNMQIHYNASTSGGKFGLGYNQNGSCCIVLRTARSCASEQFGAAGHCNQKRHRVCGKRCTARVLIAQRVSTCEEIDGEQKCRERITYEPYRKSAAAASRQRKHFDCHHAPHWPFVECRGGIRVGYAIMCQPCFELRYIDVIQQRVPPSCFPCYNFLPSPPYYTASWPHYTTPIYGPGPALHTSPAEEYDYGEQEFLHGDGWTLDGSTTTNNIDHSNDAFGDDWDYNDSEMKDYEDALVGVRGARRRRHSAKDFRRSRYSIRHRKHF